MKAKFIWKLSLFETGERPKSFTVKNTRYEIEVDRISASVSVSAPNVDKWALLADIRFRPKAVVSHSVHFRFRWATVGKFGGCRK